MENKPVTGPARQTDSGASKTAQNTATPSEGKQPHPEVIAAQVKDVLAVLLLFRFINALCVRTFFQPDEYFQALEPAWSMAFGNESGAWLTWVPFPIFVSQMALLLILLRP